MVEPEQSVLVYCGGGVVECYVDRTGPDARFDGIVGLVTDGEARLFVADAENHRIRSLADDLFFDQSGFAYGWDGYGGWAGGINAGLGAFVTSHDDLSVATVGPGLGVTRTYNSLDFHEGPFGVGWSYTYEMEWRRNASGDVSILYPDGRREVFEYEGGGVYKPPPGYFSELAEDSGGFILTTRDDSVYTFDDEGRLVEVADRNGRTTTLTYDDGLLETVEDDTSGRTITFAWADDRITQASTDTVTAHSGPLTWKYYYDADGRLAQACDPRDNTQTTGVCWKYKSPTATS